MLMHVGEWEVCCVQSKITPEISEKESICGPRSRFMKEKGKREEKKRGGGYREILC